MFSWRKGNLDLGVGERVPRLSPEYLQKARQWVGWICFLLPRPPQRCENPTLSDPGVVPCFCSPGKLSSSAPLLVHCIFFSFLKLPLAGERPLPHPSLRPTCPHRPPRHVAEATSSLAGVSDRMKGRRTHVEEMQSHISHVPPPSRQTPSSTRILYIYVFIYLFIYLFTYLFINITIYCRVVHFGVE